MRYLAGHCAQPWTSDCRCREKLPHSSLSWNSHKLWTLVLHCPSQRYTTTVAPCQYIESEFNREKLKNEWRASREGTRPPKRPITVVKHVLFAHNAHKRVWKQDYIDTSLQALWKLNQSYPGHTLLQQPPEGLTLIVVVDHMLNTLLDTVFLRA